MIVNLPASADTLPVAAQPAFSSGSGAWKVHKTDDKIIAENSVTGMVRAVFSEVDKPNEASRYKLASLVGPLLSVKASLYWEGGAHPGQVTRWETINLDTGQSPVLLTDLFAESDLLAALLRGGKIFWKRPPERGPCKAIGAFKMKSQELLRANSL